MLAACLCRVQKAEEEVAAAASEVLAVQKVEVGAGVQTVEAEAAVVTSEVLGVHTGRERSRRMWQRRWCR